MQFLTCSMAINTGLRVHSIGTDNMKECCSLVYQYSTLILRFHGVCKAIEKKFFWLFRISLVKVCLPVTLRSLWTIISSCNTIAFKMRTMELRTLCVIFRLTGSIFTNQVSPTELLLGSRRVLETFSCNNSKFQPNYHLNTCYILFTVLHLCQSPSFRNSKHQP